MTSKQIEILRKKIADIRRTLAQEKKKFGGYDDSRGLRYLPTKFFIKLGDYSGGLTYTKWFDKNFPDDAGFPEFLFEWTIILFKTGEVKKAKQKAFQTFCSNIYWFDKFFGRPLIPLEEMWLSSNTASPSYTEYLEYSNQQPELADFSKWLDTLISEKNFIERSNKYIDIYKRLKVERDRETRRYLVMQAAQLEQSS